MTKETTLATSIDSAADEAKYDAACKQLLSEKIILAWIMKNTMKEYAAISVQEIAEKYIAGTPLVAQAPVMPGESGMPKISGTGVEDSAVGEGTVTFDIRFHAVLPDAGGQIGLIINIEAQNNFYPGYPLVKRAIYYCSRMISSQHGTEFTNSHYEKIKKVCSVWICMSPPKARENTITSYSIAENHIVGNVKEQEENYDLATAIMICLGKQEDAETAGLLRLLDVLLSNDTNAAAKKRILSDDFNIPMTQQFERRMDEMCDLSEHVLRKGFERGLQKGMEQGMEQGILTSIKNLMDTFQLTAEQSMDALKISGSDRKKYSSLIASGK